MCDVERAGGGVSWRCLSCETTLMSGDEQRAHYKTEWHRYNLARRVAALRPLALDEYEQRAAAAAAVSTVTSQPQHCRVCRKSFSSANALATHESSRRHRLAAAAAPASASTPPFTRVVAMGAGADTDSFTDSTGSEADTEEVDSSEWEQWSSEPSVRCALARRCLFCPHASRSWVRSLAHMSAQHSFFIPDQEYCVDVPGLLAYLSEKISVGLLCVWCERGFESVSAVRQHMVDRGHCRAGAGDGAEYEHYYDYSTSYPPDGQLDGPRLAAGGWALQVRRGREVGHRELRRYYRQHAAARALAPRSRPAPLPARPRPAPAPRRYSQRAARRWLRLALKANKFQKHYRPQVNF